MPPTWRMTTPKWSQNFLHFPSQVRMKLRRKRAETRPQARAWVELRRKHWTCKDASWITARKSRVRARRCLIGWNLGATRPPQILTIQLQPQAIVLLTMTVSFVGLRLWSGKRQACLAWKSWVGFRTILRVNRVFRIFDFDCFRLHFQDWNCIHLFLSNFHWRNRRPCFPFRKSQLCIHFG